MILLTSTSDLIKVVSGSAADLEVHTSWVDNNAGTITPGRNNTNITTATTTTIVPSPGASVYRNVKLISILNNHASQSSTFTVEHTDGTNNVILSKGTLLSGESVRLTDNGEFLFYDAQGTLKSPTTKLDKCVYVTANSVHATAATFADINGLTVAVRSGVRYSFDCSLFHINNATTTGSQFGIGGVAMTTMVAGAISTVTNSATAAAMSTGVVTAINTAVVVQTTGSATNAPTILTGYFQPSADGTFAVRATSEVTVANGLIVLAGSWLRVREVDN